MLKVATARPRYDRTIDSGLGTQDHNHYTKLTHTHTHTHTHTLRPKFMARCHRKYTPGEISSPGSSGSRVFSPPGGCARSCFQDGSSAPRTNTPGIRYHSPLFVRQIMCQPFSGSKVKEITVAFLLLCLPCTPF